VRDVLELAEATDVWRVLPAEVAGTLRLEADASVTEMAEAIQAEVAEYSQPLDAAYAGALTRAVRHAVDTFIDRVADPDTPMTAIVTEFRGLGFAAAREGQSLEPLQAAMRLSARVGWRRQHVHVYPQTVRYRLRQVEDLFGDQLRDPGRRFELEIALRARHMLRRPGS